MNYKPLFKIFFSDKENYTSIYERRFNSESSYRLGFSIKGNEAFVVLNNDIIQKIVNIMGLNQDLILLSNMLPAAALNQYAKSCIIDEIKLTNEIEGIHSTRKEINELLSEKNKNSDSRMFGLVRKYNLIFNNKDIPLETCLDIRRLYDEFILEDIKRESPDDMPDGEVFRKDSVYIQDNKQNIIHHGITPEKNVINYMNDALKMLNNDEYDFFIRIAVFHYMFGYIHPFYDANGRMSRFISSYLLTKKLELLVAFKLSSTIKDNIKKYYKIFKDTNLEINKGDLTPFVIVFLGFIEDSIKELTISLNDRVEKLGYFSQKIDTLKVEDKLVDLIFLLTQVSLFASEGLNLDELHEILDIGKTSLRRLLKILENNDLLIVTKDGKRKLYDIDLEVLTNIDKIKSLD